MKLNKHNFSLNIPAIMGVCNVTLDSFSDGGKNYKTSEALTNIKKMYQCGAQIIDIGAESARPGSDPISYQKEINKITPILKKLPKNKFIISIDTNKIETQEFVLKNGAHVINDIFGGSEDLFLLTKKYKNGLILMHTPAPPKIMQSKVNDYVDVIKDIKKYFKKRIKQLNKHRILPSKIWFDPGIGFGKNLSQNLKIIKNIKKFKIGQYGLLMGASRKSWINSIDKSNVNERLGGSLAPVLFSQNQGVDIFRVHDVKETFQAIKVFKRIECSK